MNTFLTRSNAVFAFSLSNLAVLTTFLILSTITKDYSQLVDVKINSVRKLVKNVADYSAGRERNDLGFLSFDLDANFDKAFDWNTKQLFIFLTAQYRTKNNALSQVVLWDHIMLREDEHILSLKNQHSKYYFWDDGNGLLGNNINLTLTVNIIPNSGYIPIHMIPTSKHQFVFPTQYDSRTS
ncbi:Signal peptidase complex subunit 3 [Sarcoptes scabiei]|uniref:Signal peptidase complex subunit 3 n=1 Tax=Sarcoptes scabiei TaxID=52283 RepID=A0A834R6D8_SARSC|nr:Signal peptidase complex subunit 3 [Sarcoptes scabiei]UXI15082.1 BTB/POZ domain-containing protein 6-B-like [Sarcoptes scabiei]